MTIPRMLVFASVGELASFTKAAAQLGISKSVVSHHITSLETELSVKLLQRTTQKIELTDAGRIYLKRCLEIRRISQLANDEVQQKTSILQGPLRITAPHALIDTLIGPATADFVYENPLIKPDLIIDDARREVIRENIDIAISVGHLPDSTLKIRKLGLLEEILCASPLYLANNGPIINTEDLINYDYIGNHWEGNLIQKKLYKDGSPHTVQIGAATRRSNSVFTTRIMSIQGLGIACLPLSVVSDDILQGRLIKILPEYNISKSPISAIHAYGNLAPARIKLYIDHLKKYTQSLSIFQG